MQHTPLSVDDPNAVEALIGVAEAKLAQGDHASARSYFKEAFNLASSDGEAAYIRQSLAALPGD